MERDTTTTRDRTVASAPPVTTEVVRETTAVLAVPQNISWGAIWAGVLTAFGLLFLFSILALAAGLTAFDFGQAAPADVPVDAIALIVTGIFLAVAFFVGGFVAAWAAGQVEEGPAIMSGFLVWATSVVLVLVLAGLGAGQALGGFGAVFGPQFAPGEIEVDEALTEAFTEAAWQTVFAIVLAMAAAILGALLAIRDEIRGRDWSAYSMRR